ncbi:MAG TPA: hypothetical protein VL752_11115 [Acidisoma sp.]|uniref:hypothetical protein n=1 Tax=Acidisoma sp. TaxID=1872115 RepID=UPI002B53E30E|nr:hypothetical protein [Acidisoma sp.]HTI01485.1 hypothetical protein [Acidisoma sp.]
MDLSQAEFARLMGVSRKSVTDWKRKGLIVMLGDLVDREASLRRLVDAGNARALTVILGTAELVTLPNEPVSLLPSAKPAGHSQGNNVGRPPRQRRPRRETPAEAAERIVLSTGGLLSMADAQTVKASYLARLRQLEYDTKAGQVVHIREVVEAVGAEYARVRARLLAIPAEQAPRLAQLKSVPEIQDALMRTIVETLEELTRDGDGPAAAPSGGPI